MSDIKSLIEARVSTGRYDSTRPLADEQVAELVRLATRAPSAYNMQNWKFIAVRSADAKQRLQSVSYGQSQVVDAPVTFIICGTLAAYEGMSKVLQPSVEAGFMDPSIAAGWVEAVTGSHRDNPQLQRDEAFRSASLAAMTLMFAAQGMGLASGAMSGFDPAALAQAFGLADNEVPVMLVTVGYPRAGNWPQKPRRPLADVMRVA